MPHKTIHSFFDNETNKFYKLFSTRDLPCLEISGIRMHCVGKGVKASTLTMVEQLKPLKGIVLDTCAGLGYTTIMIADTPRVEKVYAFEVDKNVLEIARHNPFSEKLFSNKKIRLKNKDVFSGLKEFPDSFFDRILHDPPRFALAGELYGREFYKKLFRVLKPSGILFHFTGSPGEKQGKGFKAGVVKRLRGTGFRKIKIIDKALGVRAVK